MAFLNGNPPKFSEYKLLTLALLLAYLQQEVPMFSILSGCVVVAALKRAHIHAPPYPATLYTVLHCTVYTIRRSTLNKIHFSLPYKEYNVHCTHTVHNAQYTL